MDIGTQVVYQTTYITKSTNITLTFTNSSSNGYCNEILYILYVFFSFIIKKIIHHFLRLEQLKDDEF